MALPGRSSRRPRVRRPRRGGRRASAPEEQGRQQDLSLARNRRRGRRARVLLQAQQSHQQLVLRACPARTCSPARCLCASSTRCCATASSRARTFSRSTSRGSRRTCFAAHRRSARGAGVLGIECETNFRTSIVYPESHFGLIHGIVLALRSRAVRSQLQPHSPGRLSAGAPPQQPAGSAAGGMRNARNLQRAVLPGACRPSATTACTTGKCRPPPSVDQILKTMAIYELHGFNDIALQTAVAFAEELGERLDVERAIDLLCRQTDLAVEPARAICSSKSGPMPRRPGGSPPRCGAGECLQKSGAEPRSRRSARHSICPPTVSAR